MRPHPLSVIALLSLGVGLLAPTLLARPCQEAAAPAAESGPEGGPDAGPPSYDASEVMLDFFRPVHSDARQLVGVLYSLEGRTFRVRDGDGQVAGTFRNIEQFEDIVVLHDVATKVARMQAVLQSLDEAAAPRPEGEAGPLAGLEVATYVPRFQSCDGLMRALEPYRRTYSNDTVSASGQRFSSKYDNVARINSPAALVLRDTPANLAAMQALLARLDVRPAQGIFSCRILFPAGDGEPSESLPAELVENLRRLLPYDGYATGGYSAVRVSIVPGGSVELVDVLKDDGGLFKLQLRPSGYDADTGLLSIDACQFEVEDREVSLSTSTVVAAGQYTVLGVAGRPPLFVVLQFTPEAD